MSVSGLERLLSEHEFFRGLDPDRVAFLAACGRNERFGEGEYLLREGQPAERFFVIREGRAAIEIDVPNRGPLVVDTVGPDEVLGFSWLFPPYRWRFDARTLSPMRAVVMDGVCIRAKSDADPSLGYELMKRFSLILERRMQSARVRLLDVYGHGRAG